MKNTGTIFIQGHTAEYCHKKYPSYMVLEVTGGHMVFEWDSDYKNYLAAEQSRVASAMGKLGGSRKTEAKSTASRTNGRLGGRPKKDAL